MGDGLLNLGPKSRLWLAELGIHTGAQLRQRDAFVVYADLKRRQPGASLNLLYALLGAQQDCHWQQVKREQRSDILLRLDDMGLAPKR
ncbi:DNA transformation protein [Inhella inkyongensis]|uniref:DNA transformation protein n=1 Tax=Inhella inkyongensis TaxID=392593 RepID=A0A840S9A2_9BURK|nr:TfoX/Sxy family DNA transformation protein [Inhella inkyongensis]MBB5205101.1 DNA transformation protein [Inhella inkyongensis]